MKKGRVYEVGLRKGECKRWGEERESARGGLKKGRVDEVG